MKFFRWLLALVFLLAVVKCKRQPDAPPERKSNGFFIRTTDSLKNSDALLFHNDGVIELYQGDSLIQRADFGSKAYELFLRSDSTRREMAYWQSCQIRFYETYFGTLHDEGNGCMRFEPTENPPPLVGGCKGEGQ